MDRKKAKKIAIAISIVAFAIFIMGVTSYNPEKVKNVVTPYNTTCKLNIGGGLIGDGEVINKNWQKISFKDTTTGGLFISTSKDKVEELIKYIPTIGTEYNHNGVTWYNFKGQQSADIMKAFQNTHLKLRRANEYNIGFLENPNSNEVIILVASPNKLIDCFNSVKWGN